MVKSYRVGKSYSMLQETELRLTISKEFIEAQGGEIRVDSAMGEGNVFSFKLPLLPG